MYTHSTGTPQLDFDGDIYPLHLFFSAQTAQHFALERVNRHVYRIRNKNRCLGSR